MADIIHKYFPKLTSLQLTQLNDMQRLYAEWNSIINVISRKDFDNFYTNHVLHSLAIAKKFSFEQNDKILDIATGGGFPGIPLAILFPHTSFTLIDSVGKKIKVVNAVTERLGLDNVKAINIRAEQHNSKYSYVTTRAVAPLQKIVCWCEKNIDKKRTKRGIIALKGGSLHEEVKEYRERVRLWNISEFFSESYFETKMIVFMKI